MATCWWQLTGREQAQHANVHLACRIHSKLWHSKSRLLEDAESSMPRRIGCIRCSIQVKGAFQTWRAVLRFIQLPVLPALEVAREKTWQGSCHACGRSFAVNASLLAAECS